MNSNHHFMPSQRALAAADQGLAWDRLGLAQKYPSFEPELRPDGVINLMGAKNSLMVDWMRNYIDLGQTTDTFEALSYGKPSGSAALRDSAANFINSHFNPSSQVEASHVLATNGVTSAIDLLAFSICEPGDAVVYPVPAFHMFGFNLTVRNGVVGVPVAIEKTVRDAFAPTEQAAEELELAFTRAIDEATGRGLHCRVLCICNPSNPQGRCYAPATLERLARLCSKRRMHLVSDEIYAISNFSQGKELFSSVLSIPTACTADFRNVHCLYGLSKDFGLGGLRLGLIITRNKHLMQALGKMSLFSWISNNSDIFATRFLQRLDLVEDYIYTYQKRLAEAYTSVSKTLHEHNIPFRPATSGLFIFINLSTWLKFFPNADLNSERYTTKSHAGQELELWQWLLDNGVALSPGQYSQSESPGWFRFVFSGDLSTTLIAVSRIGTALDRLAKSHAAYAIKGGDNVDVNSKPVAMLETNMVEAWSQPHTLTKNTAGRRTFKRRVKRMLELICCSTGT